MPPPPLIGIKPQKAQNEILRHICKIAVSSLYGIAYECCNKERKRTTRSPK